MEFGVFDHLDRHGGALADYYEDRLKIAEAYDLFGSRRDGVLKVAIRP